MSRHTSRTSDLVSNNENLGAESDDSRTNNALTTVNRQNPVSSEELEDLVSNNENLGAESDDSRTNNALTTVNRQNPVSSEELEDLVSNNENLGAESDDSRTNNAITTVNRQNPVSSEELEDLVSNNENLGAESDDSRTNNAITTVNRQNPVSSDGPKPSLTRNRSFYTPYMEDKLCRRLKFHFMGPDEKIRAKRKCPWKLIVQILKILMVTAQLIQLGYSSASFVEYKEKTIISLQSLYLKDWTNSYETMPYPPAIGKYALYKLDEVIHHINYAMQELINFGHNRSSFVEFTEKSTLAMKHIYLMNWSNSYETLSYPPASGPYALYTNEEFIQHINFAMKAYDDTENAAIGSLRLPRFHNGTQRPMKMCLKQYSSSLINSTANTYQINSTISDPCYSIGPIEGEYNITKFTKQNKIEFETIFDRLLVITLKFTLKSFRLDMNERHFPPQLYTVDVEIKLDDSNKDGQMLVTLDAVLDEIEVKGHTSNEDAEKLQRVGLVVFDSFVMAVTIMSMILCTRSVLRAQSLRKETAKFFYQSRGKKLSLSDQFEFVNLWYVTIIINDILTLIGSGYKIQLETRSRGKKLSMSDQFEFVNLWYVTIIINDILTLIGSGYKIQLETRFGTITVLLFWELAKFFCQSRGKKLSMSDQFEFVNLWYVTIIINDILTLIGSGYKIQLETRSRGKKLSMSDQFEFVNLWYVTIIINDILTLIGSGYKIQLETKSRGKKLSMSDQFEFVNLWYVTIIINDILTLIGSGYKIQLETRALKSSSSNYDICGLMLGTGSLLAWLGVLRYIGYFQQFNILIITLKKAFPNMLRFLACCMMLYIGFVICGWVVLGPYHIKFRQMSTASECLFSLVNGDDMFVTFSALTTDNSLVWYYSRFYLYIFISLFIYAVLNLFIAVIMDTYETIKKYNEEGFPKSELFQFIDQCEDPVHSPVYRQEDNSCNPLSYLCCCCKQQNPDHPNEYTSLIN